MCGIFGGIAIKDPASTLELMGNILSHRGPDDKGTFIKDNVALGHRRLSIIDLLRGHQPMQSFDGKQAIVYNGEIYNYKDVREELAKKGYKFNTESDTEVILNAYKEWGVDCLDRFNGMFAFALWDSAINKLWLARDRIGKKPLYFMRLEKGFYFASEGKALWQLPFFNPEYDMRAIDQYLTFRYAPGNRSFFKGIEKLPPGYWMLVDSKAEICQMKKWWDASSKRSAKPLGWEQDGEVGSYLERFHALFSDAVRLRLIADVPVGLFLSSGIDSSSIAFEMAKLSNPLFISIGFGEKTDELASCQLLAQKLNARHYSFLMQESDFSLLPEAVSSMDEPYGDLIILPSFLLAKKASEKVKVILTGDGADEVLGAYIHQEYFRKVFNGFPTAVIKLLGLMINFLPLSFLDLIFHYPASLGRLGKQRLKNLLTVYPDPYLSYMNFASVFNEEDKKSLYSNQIKKQLAMEQDDLNDEMSAHFGRTDLEPLDLVIQWDLKTWLPQQTLMKLDRLTMAHSVEGRCPYTDYRLIESLLGISSYLFRHISRNKYILRFFYQARANSLLKKKQAFYLPLHNLFNARVENLISETLNKENLEKTGLFNFSYVKTLFERRKHSPLLADKQLMSLVILLLWLRSVKEDKGAGFNGLG